MRVLFLSFFIATSCILHINAETERYYSPDSQNLSFRNGALINNVKEVHR